MLFKLMNQLKSFDTIPRCSLGKKIREIILQLRTCGEYINLSTLPLTPNKLLFNKEAKMKIKVLRFLKKCESIQNVHVETFW